MHEAAGGMRREHQGVIGGGWRGGGEELMLIIIDLRGADGSLHAVLPHKYMGGVSFGGGCEGV